MVHHHSHSLAFCFLIRPLMFHGTGILLAHLSWIRKGLFLLTVTLWPYLGAHHCYHTSTMGLPIHEDRPPSSLFASRTLPPLRPHPYHCPQPYPLPRLSEWPSPQYRRDDGSPLRRHHPREYDEPRYTTLPSPFTTSPSEDGHTRPDVDPHPYRRPSIVHFASKGNTLYEVPRLVSVSLSFEDRTLV